MDRIHALHSRDNFDETIVASFLPANIYYQETPNDYIRHNGLHCRFKPHILDWHGSSMCMLIHFCKVFLTNCFLESNTRDMDKLDVQRGADQMHRCIRCSLRPSRHQYPPQPFDFNFPNPNTLATGTLLAQKGKSHDHVFGCIICPHL